MPDHLLQRARSLRRRSTKAEKVLWQRLRARQMAGRKFRRQQPLGVYIVDFVCFESMLVVELDGGQHATETQKDEKRDRWLVGEGYTVLRFWNNDVMVNIDGVLERIRKQLIAPSP